MNRVDEQTTPDASVTRNVYNEAGLLQAVDVQIRGAMTWCYRPLPPRRDHPRHLRPGNGTEAAGRREAA